MKLILSAALLRMLSNYVCKHAFAINRLGLRNKVVMGSISMWTGIKSQESRVKIAYSESSHLPLSISVIR